MTNAYRIDEHDQLKLALCGRLAEAFIATGKQWWRPLIARTIARHNTSTTPGNCTISVYGSPYDEIVVLLDPAPQPPVCYMGYAPDMLVWNELPETAGQDIRRELDVFHHKN